MPILVGTTPKVDDQVTTGNILAAMDETFVRLDCTLSLMRPVLDSGPDAGGWTARQVLSHLVGAWQRIPVHAGYFLDDTFSGVVSIQFHSDYWIPEWETAPLEAFARAMEAAYIGARIFVQDLDPAALHSRALTPFGTVTLGELLLTSVKGHIADFHTPQLEAFLQA